MTDPRVQQALDAIASRLVKTGWCQKHWGPEEGPNCLAGALIYEIPREGTFRDKVRDELLDRVEVRGYMTLVGFNDDDRTSLIEVLSLLEPKTGRQHVAHRPSDPT